MRTRLFATDPVLVDGSDVVICQKDIDGHAPVTLYLENEDIAAKVRIQNGDKNAQLMFTALVPGADGNIISVKLTAVANQAFSVVVDDQSPYDIFVTVNLACDSQGVPTQPAYEVMDGCNDDNDFNDVLVASLAPGSDGSAHMGATADFVALDGGFDSQALGAVVVKHSPYADGPWDTSTTAGTAFSSCTADTTIAFTIDTPVRGLLVTASKGSTDSMPRITAIRDN